MAPSWQRSLFSRRSTGFCPSFASAVRLCGTRAAGLAAALAFTAVSSSRAAAQISSEPTRLSSASVFVTIGAENSQLLRYADNASGFDAGIAFKAIG